MKRLLSLLCLLASTACSGSSGGGGDAPPSTAGMDILENPFVGPKRVLYVPVGLTDVPSLFPSTAAGRAELTAMLTEVRMAFDADSGGRVAVRGDMVWPPVQLATASTDYDQATGLIRVREDVLAAVRALGFDPDLFDREAILLPVSLAQRSARGWVRTVWMPHKLTWVLYHELGHTLGRPHANFWDGDPVGNGNTVEYGDVFDPMGTGRKWNRFYHSGAWFKFVSGWLDETDVLEVAISGTFTLSPLEASTATTGPKALRIRRDANEDYWIFHRSSEEVVASGPVIVRTRNDPFASPLLLDMNPGTLPETVPEQADCELSRGQTFDDSAFAGITVRNVTLEGQPITIEITLDEARQAALDNPPIVDVLSPSRDGGPVAGEVEFKVVAYDTDRGTFDGAGIERVTLEILSTVNDGLPVVIALELLARPYSWALDTRELDDAFHFLRITAEATDGGRTVSLFRFIVDNGSSSGG